MNASDATHQTDELTAGWGCLSLSPHTHTAAAEAASDTGLPLYELSVPGKNTAGLAQGTFTQNIDTSAISVKGQNVKTGKTFHCSSWETLFRSFSIFKTNPTLWRASVCF